jgi:catechol-2,3-dioxygenase
MGAIVGSSDHGTSKSIYAVDPDGNEFEVMWMLPRAEWGAYENAAPVDRIDLAAEVAKWSGVGTARELVPLTAGSNS